MQGIHARGTRASTTRSRRHAVSAITSRLAQADWRTQKQRQGTRRQVQSTRKQEGHTAQAPGPGETRASRMVNDEPNERSVGIRLRLVSEYLGLFLPARTHPNEQPGVLRQCHVARRYCSAHASAGRASALGHSW